MSKLFPVRCSCCLLFFIVESFRTTDSDGGQKERNGGLFLLPNDKQQTDSVVLRTCRLMYCSRVERSLANHRAVILTYSIDIFCEQIPAKRFDNFPP